MEIFEKINRAFGGWYEGLFGGNDDVRPRDILRRILTAMEEHRKEGIDGKVYVPNQYILEIAVDDEEEKEYLLSFLDREELEAAIRRYCQQNHYNVRGGLDFTIKEVEQSEDGKRREKVRVRCRYDSKLAAEKPAPEPVEVPAPPLPAVEGTETVYDSIGSSDEGTVPGIPMATLRVELPGTSPTEVPLNQAAFSIGRSSRAGNDLVLDHDGMVSRRHARIELEADGKFTIYDLETTNGTRVNGKKIDNRSLASGDEIVIGATHIRFTQSEISFDGSVVHHPRGSEAFKGKASGVKARLVLTDGTSDLDSFVLASETIVGRGATNDIVLADRSVSTRHIRLRRGTPFTVEPLDGDALTLVNGAPVPAGASAPLQNGDRIGIGAMTMRFEVEEA